MPLKYFTISKEQCDNKNILETIKDRLLNCLLELAPTAHIAYLKKVPKL